MQGRKREEEEESPFLHRPCPPSLRLRKRGLIVGRPDLWEIIMRRLICERGKDACFAAASTICYSGHNSVGKEKNRKRPWGGRILVHPIYCIIGIKVLLAFSGDSIPCCAAPPCSLAIRLQRVFGITIIKQKTKKDEIKKIAKVFQKK